MTLTSECPLCHPTERHSDPVFCRWHDAALERRDAWLRLRQAFLAELPGWLRRWLA